MLLGLIEIARIEQKEPQGNSALHLPRSHSHRSSQPPLHMGFFRRGCIETAPGYARRPELRDVAQWNTARSVS